MLNMERLGQRLTTMDRRLLGIGLGLLLGVVAGLIGLGVVLLDPLIMVGGVAGLLLGLYLLTDLNAALFGILLVVALFPFGTLPINVGLTPTFLDAMIGVFLLVYLFQWMTGRRRLLQSTPVHMAIMAFALLLVFAFILGLAYAPPTTALLRQFAEMLLAILLPLVLVDVMRNERTLRRTFLLLLMAGGLTAAVGLFLYVLPDDVAERLLVTLARFGYPNGGVIRYVESNPALAERAIGVWVDPNAFGGVLAVLGAMVAPQVFASEPLGGRYGRWLMLGLLVLIGGCIYLTFSRAAMMAFGVSLVFIAALRYRKLLLLLAVLAVIALFVPFTQEYLQRAIEGLQGADLATQMRAGEYKDALTLIGRYPLLGVGFTGTPQIDLYLGAASLYLTMAANIGLLGVGVFLLTMLAVFGYGLTAWRRPERPERFETMWLGAHAGLLAALAAGTLDHYFFKPEFQASVTLFWLVVGLALSTSRLWRQAEKTPRLT